MSRKGRDAEGIAIVGMAGRFPRAKNVDEFWRNLCHGVEGISFFADEDLAAAGVDAPKDDPNYVKARGVLEDADLFDAAFFGVKPREAEVMDPQHRVFLECAWEALESAGYDSDRHDGSIGVFAGLSMNTYLVSNLASRPDLLRLLGEYQVMLGNDKDFLPTRVSYKLNLKGPSLNIQTACSTSLVAVCVACQHLLNCQCDTALAGAVSISFPQRKGYLYQEGGIASPDGHCRAFDAKAAGTVAGEGVGIVVLKRLADALADGDSIHAVIKGFAMNNDGANKMGYTAPSVEGQAEVIAMAQAVAGVEPESIGYIEAHGTATPLGDPIEIEGLTRAFRVGTDKTQFCALGSVKSNVGHLDAAAGVAGLIKTALALQERKLPPSLHFESPNPKIDFAHSPFYVNAQLAEWKNGAAPRRAGVSSFGIGGTNAHVVLEEAPAVQPSGPSRAAQLILLSAKTSVALDRARANLAEHFANHPELNFADAASTLQLGRRAFPHRLMLVSRDADDAARALAACDPKRVLARVREHEHPAMVFMFPGQGAQQVNMGRELYQTEPAFRETVDVCAGMLSAHLGLDLRRVLYPEAADLEEAASELTRTALAQPAMFVIEYALAQLWMSWGVHPESMIGHSIGEYVAACVAGVLSLEDALRLVAARGRLMQQLPAGMMLALRLPERELQPLLGDRLSLAAVNGASLCVVSGPADAVEELRRQLEGRHIASTPLQTSHAFHSRMMEPILAPFAELVRSLERNAPKLPFISNVTGTWITAEQATDPAYWACHLRQTVRFAEGIGELLKTPERVFLEVGPGQTLSGLTRQHPARSTQTPIVSSLPRSNEKVSEVETMLSALGQLWLAGAIPDWRGFQGHEQRRRVRLPAYPFERQRFWVAPARVPLHQSDSSMRSATLPSSGIVETEKPPEEWPTAKAAGPVARENGRAPMVRKDEIIATLRTLLRDLSGFSLAEMKGDTTFAEMGFESLFLTQASLAMEKEFGIRIAFRQLLEEFSTLDALAAYIDRTLPAAGCSVAPPGRDNRPQSPAKPPGEDIGPRPPRDFPRDAKTGEPKPMVLPLTEAQRELWFASQVSDAASCAYNESRLLHLRGALLHEALRDALQQLVDRHEALRTTFAPAGDAQAIHPALELEVPVADWSGAAADEQTARLEAQQIQEARHPFDLVRGPLLRARLLRLCEQHHVLVLTVHHIVCDGHSLGILLREMSELYSAAARDVSGSLAAPLQLSAYASEQARPAALAGRAADEAFWLSQFSDGTPVLELPTDYPRPSEWSFAGARASRLLSSSLAKELQQLSAQQGCTLFTTLLAVYALWLRRLANQPDLVVGIPTADRAMAGGGTLVGHCINFLPLRLRLGDDRTFAEHLGGVQRTFLDAYEHQRYGFGSLLQKLEPPRDPSRMPLVSVTFNVERWGEALRFPGLETELTANAHSLTNFDLSFNVTELNGTLLLDCRYNTGLFQAATIQRWLGHFQTLLEGIVADPEQPISRPTLLSADERQRILVEWNETKADYHPERCLHQLVEEQAARTPDAPAVVCRDERLSYRELDALAAGLAGRLQRLGVGPDVPVGLCLSRSVGLVVGVLAILKAGGAYVPLDPAYPRERLALMLKNARVPVLLTETSLRDALQLEAADLKVVCLDDVLPEMIGAPAVATPQATNLAYVIHTSGSTGVPKAVAIEHRSAVNFVRWAQSVFTSEELAGVLFCTSICFDLSVFELFVTLSSGGRVIVVQNALEVSELPEKHGVTLINTVPSAVAELLRLNAVPPSVQVVNLAGEPLKPALVDRLYASGPVRKVYDLYGPSETTTYSTCALRQANGPGTIGRPIANTQLFILDPSRQPVPVGVVGEIYIGGAGLARGYLHRPDLTAESFVPNPHHADPGARLYKTGDLARWRPDGNIEFLGRADHQVKIRGYRVELGEIESVLDRHPAVRECVAVAREDGAEKRLAAYIVPEPDQASVTSSELHDFLRKALPEHMLPSAFVFLEALPTTPNGKVNRRALPAPEPVRSGSREAFVAPGTPTEEALAGIWREILGLEQAGVQDNFFASGGHSLLMMQVISRVRETFQVVLPIRRFFAAPTIAALAGVIEELLIEEIKELSDEEVRRASSSSSWKTDTTHDNR